MYKRTSFLFFIILLVSTMPLPQTDALGIGPPSFELDVPMDGFNSTTFYMTSDGLNGELIVGKENLPFRIEPSRINMTRDDVNVPVELTFYGNETLKPGIYEGKVTFLAMTGGFIAIGIKVKAEINLVGKPKGFSVMNLGIYSPYIAGAIALLAIIIFVKKYRITLIRRS